MLPNHYHVLVEAPDIKKLLAALGRFHGRTSYEWNDEERARGRKVFFRCTERYMRSDRHYWATVNYVNHNPVHHRYVRLWTDRPWSSATQYIEQMGRAEVARIWNEHPIKEYGKKWDPAEL